MASRAWNYCPDVFNWCPTQWQVSSLNTAAHEGHPGASASGRRVPASGTHCPQPCWDPSIPTRLAQP